MLDRAEQEWHCQHIHRRHEVPDQRHIGAIEIDRAGAGLLDRLLFLAKLARMKNADLQPSAAAFRNQATHEAQRLDGRIVFILGIGRAKFARKNARRRHHQQQRNNEGQGPRKVGAVHRQRLPLIDGVCGRWKRFNGFLAEAGENRYCADCGMIVNGGVGVRRFTE